MAVVTGLAPLARARLCHQAREDDKSIKMMRVTLFAALACSATVAFVPHLKLTLKSRLLAADGGDAPAVEVPKAKAVEAEAPKVAPSPAEDPFDQPKAEAKAAPAAADAPPKKAPAKPVAAEADAKPDAVAKPPATPAAKVDEATADAAAADKPKPVPKKAPPKKAEAGDAPAPAMKAEDGEKPTPVPKKAPPPAAKADAADAKPAVPKKAPPPAAKAEGDAPAKKAPVVPKKAPIKAKEGGDAPAAMKPPAADGDAPAKKAIPKKAPPPKKEEKHPYYAWANSPEAGYNTKAPAAYYKEKSQYDLGWFGKYDDSKTEAERSARFLARHDGVGGESYQTRTKERVYKEIAALKEERQARARRARERRGW